MESIDIALIIALVFSVVLHEMAHGYAANWLGDPTARLAGRLNPNPIVHLDPLMSVILPAMLVLSGSPLLFGAAKPVPYNPYNFTKHRRWGEAIVAAAGPATNIAIAIVFAVLINFAGVFGFGETFIQLSVAIIALNIFLALFNLVPIPPLDGSKILPRFLPRPFALQYEQFRMRLEHMPFLGFALVILLFVVVLAEPIHRLTMWLTFILIGI